MHEAGKARILFAPMSQLEAAIPLIRPTKPGGENTTGHYRKSENVPGDIQVPNGSIGGCINSQCLAAPQWGMPSLTSLFDPTRTRADFLRSAKLTTFSTLLVMFLRATHIAHKARRRLRCPEPGGGFLLSIMVAGLPSRADHWRNAPTRILVLRPN